MTAPWAESDLQQRQTNRRTLDRVNSKQSAEFGAGGFSIGRVLGVEIRVDWSLLIIFALVVFNLGAAAFPAWHPGWPPWLTWSLALAAALLFFASIAVHELAHAVVARRHGIPVRRITLFLFGGVAQMEKEPETPKAEFWMAIVGPMTSLLIGMVALALGTWLASFRVPVETLQDPVTAQVALRAVGPGATLLLWLGPINIALGVFNMIPGFPLDGGRVFRSLLWWRTGDLVKATRWASSAGRLFAWILMAIGVVNLFTGDPGQGVWLLLIGWFLHSAAASSYQQLLARRALEDVPVRQLMRTNVDSVSPELTVNELVGRLMIQDQRCFPVQADGTLIGIVCFDDVRRAPQSQWSQTRVADIMTPVEHVVTLPADADAEQALDVLARRDVDQIPVVDQGHLLGLVRRTDILKWVALRSPASPA